MTVDIAELTRYELTEDCTTGMIDVTPVPDSMEGRFVLYDDVAEQLKAAQARIAELEGNQEPPRELWTCDDCGVEWLDEHESKCHCSGTLGTWSLSKLYPAPPSKVIKLPEPARIPYMRGHSTKVSYMNAYRPEDILSVLRDAGIVVKDSE